jgi:hypothetical protein
MSEEQSGSWYHCGHCGSVFRSNFGYDEERVCESCQRKPGTGVWPIITSIRPDSSAKVASFNKKAEKVVKLKRTEPENQKRTRHIYWVALIWSIILFLAAGIRYYYSSSNKKNQTVDSASSPSLYHPEDREKYMGLELPLCDQVLRGFISAGTVEEMGAFVFKNKDFVSQLEVFNADHRLIRLDADSLNRIQQDMFRLDNEWVIWTQWSNPSGEVRFDAVFRKDESVWKLDWPAFSHHNPVSWKDFLTGSGPDRSEFRVLARQLKEDEIARLDRNFIQIILIEPVWGKPREGSADASIFMVDQMSKEAQLLSAAFEVRKRNQIFYNAKVPPFEVDEWIRLTVVVSRDGLDDKFRFELDEIKACHWAGSDASGFDPERLKMNKF